MSFPTGPNVDPIISGFLNICSHKSHYISIKTHGTGTKLYNTSQLYLSIPLFYPMWGNTHFSMFSFFGAENTKTENARPPKK